MPEEVLFESESDMSREEVAAYLRQFADSVEGGGDVTLRAGDQSVTMRPPGRMEFEIKAEREGLAGEPGELSIELELEWDEDDGDGDGPLEIE
jgi:amphi-Trp domain-containing protein